MAISRLRLNLLWLTLLAFGVQVAVADFHHHRSAATGISARSMVAGMCGPGSKAHPCSPLRHDHDGCALCWATAVAATSLAPALFQIPAPSEAAGVKFAAVNPLHVGFARPTEERARGPPDSFFG